LEHFQTAGNGGCVSPLSYPIEVIIIVVCCLLGIVWAVFNIINVEKINVRGASKATNSNITEEQESTLLELGAKISNVLIFSFRVPKNSSNKNTLSASFSQLWCSSSSFSLLNKDYGLPLHSLLVQLSPLFVVSSEWSLPHAPTTELLIALEMD